MNKFRWGNENMQVPGLFEPDTCQLKGLYVMFI